MVAGLVTGETYEFKLECTNSYGTSQLSETIAVLCAFIPDAPLTVATANSNDQVSVTWSEPVDNGTPITGFKVFVEEKGTGTFTQESVDCDGFSSAVVTTRQCQISLSTLRAAPFNLVKDDSVNVKVISTNVYGDSPFSSVGSGAVIQYVPDAPVSLTNDPTVTTDTRVRFTWSAGASDGGTQVIDYAVYYDQGIGTYTLLDGAVLE